RLLFVFSSRRRHTRSLRDWSSDVCSSDLLHLKDLKDLKNPKTQVPVGEGAMPIAEIFKQLVKQGFAGYANLEYEIDANDPLPGKIGRASCRERASIGGVGR